MLSNLSLFRFSSPGSPVIPLILTGCFLLALTVNARAGFLYVLTERSGGNQIYGFNVNETTGALVPLAGFPVASGGIGSATEANERMAIDRTNFRLYVLNTISFTVSAFSINPANGALTHLPFSPFSIPNVIMRTVKVHPSGSPVIVGITNETHVYSFNITPNAATAAAGSPYSTSPAQSYSSVFSRDGNFLYIGGNAFNTFAGFGVNPTTGVLTPLPGSPYDSGQIAPRAYAIDSMGRLFMANSSQNQLRAFTTSAGIPTAVTGNPFTAGLTRMENGALHPNEKFYYVSDELGGNRVGGYSITGIGAATTLAPVTGSPVGSGGTEPNTIILNNAGTFLFAANRLSRNITTYSVNPSTGGLEFVAVQPANTAGTDGQLTGMDYLPSTAAVLNTNDSGAASLRQAITALNAAGGGIVFFHPNIFNVPRTISLTSGQLSIDSNIEIVGTGAKMLTIRNIDPEADLASRVFRIGSEKTVKLSGMTISGGNLTHAGNGAGININISAFVTIRNCHISGNTAGGFGGGIYNRGRLTIINSTISGNHSNFNENGGGGIDNSGLLFITNSTISGNTKTGGVNDSGGIWTNVETTITNSTITNNSVLNGAGGVFRNQGAVTIRNSIIAGNRNNSTVPDVAGSFTSGGFNLIGNVGAATGFNQTGDQTGSGAAPLNPGLVKVLAPNGRIIPTHALLPNSPAVDKGDNFNLMTDQRGFDRPFDTGSIPNAADGADIGAFERRALEPNITAPFDFDGDNRTDISVFRPSDGSWWYLSSSDLSGHGFSFGLGTDIITPGDFTGDGKTDIGVFRPSTAEWFIQRSEDGSYAGVPFGLPGDFPAPADYDGDKIIDLAVFRPSNQTWFIQQSGGGFGILTFGLDGDRPVPADYDGDGKADIAVWRPSNGTWWIVHSSDLSQHGYGFGLGTDRPVVGDYTGDGKADIAVWRDATREWLFLRSEDGSYYSYPSGLPGDIPSPGDYDGDGKFDSAVFRPSTQTWFIDGSTAGSMIATFGLNGDRPVPNAFVP